MFYFHLSRDGSDYVLVLFYTNLFHYKVKGGRSPMTYESYFTKYTKNNGLLRSGAPHVTKFPSISHVYYLFTFFLRMLRRTKKCGGFNDLVASFAAGCMLNPPIVILCIL
uniref:Uncharacterized protein n=1 Tax=Morchella brunnea TaxID=1174671 RepID=A0A8K1MEU1_9PEZI|nr:hypothetical protein LK370_mgp209 [Morchella brunnea]UBU98494.1 hypothetical protein [Morchella brunnea]